MENEKKPLVWTFIDKSEWTDGPWHDEPDKLQFYDPITKATCLIVRNHGGALCGYVGVPEGHPAFNKHYDEVQCYDVHGGLTFSNFCAEEREEGICHIAYPGEPDRIWWLGFDCAHSGDRTPAYELDVPCLRDGHYKDIDYVTQECLRLAKQLFQ